MKENYHIRYVKIIHYKIMTVIVVSWLFVGLGMLLGNALSGVLILRILGIKGF